MPLHRKNDRSSSNSQRRLFVEPLENRALLAAGILGHVEELTGKPEIARDMTPHVAAEIAVVQSPVGAESPQFSARQVRDESIHPSRVATAIELRQEQRGETINDRALDNRSSLNRAASDRVAGDRVAGDRAVGNRAVGDRAVGNRAVGDRGRHVLSVERERLLEPSSIADRDFAERNTVFANLVTRTRVPARESVVALSTPLLTNVSLSPSGVDVQVVDVGWHSLGTPDSEVAGDDGASIRSTIPSSIAFQTPLNVDSIDSVHRGTLLEDSDSEGGMVRLDGLEQQARPSSQDETDQPERWQIQQRTIDKIVENSESESQINPAGKDSIIATDHSREGGLVAFDAMPLPTVTGDGFGEHSDIRLDPSIGRFRSFEIAAAPGHDIHTRATGETLVSMTSLGARLVEETSELESESDKAAAGLRLLDSPVAYAGVAFVSAMIVMVESRSPKDVSLNRKARHSFAT